VAVGRKHQIQIFIEVDLDCKLLISLKVKVVFVEGGEHGEEEVVAVDLPTSEPELNGDFIGGAGEVPQVEVDHLDRGTFAPELGQGQIVVGTRDAIKEVSVGVDGACEVEVEVLLKGLTQESDGVQKV